MNLNLICLLTMVCISCESKVSKKQLKIENELTKKNQTQTIGFLNYNEFHDTLSGDSIIEALLSKYESNIEQWDSMENFVSVYNDANFDSFWMSRELPNLPNKFASENIGIVFSCFQIYNNSYSLFYDADSLYVLMFNDSATQFDYYWNKEDKVYVKIKTPEIIQFYNHFDWWVEQWRNYGIKNIRIMKISPIVSKFRFIKTRKYPTATVNIKSN